MRSDWLDFIITLAAIIIFVLPLAISIILGVFVSWWFLFINAIYFVVIPLLVVYWYKVLSITNMGD